MVVICIDVPTQKMWYFEGNDILGKTTLSIGLGKSKYSKHEITHAQLVDRLLFSYVTLEKKSKDHLMIPITPQQQKEHTNRKYRETILHECCFEYPTVDGTKYDVIINGFKVQDKCAQRVNENKYFSLDLRGYQKGDNDYYWVNLPDQVFYILPESLLLLSSNIIKRRLYLGQQYDKYKYDLKNNPESIDVVKKLFYNCSNNTH
jgi:hypothetical protein